MRMDLEKIPEETIYAEDFRDELLDDDVINAWEHGFMEGWDKAETEE